jgi:hypothetical protein
MALGLNYECLRSVTSGDAYRESQIGVSPYIVGFACAEICASVIILSTQVKREGLKTKLLPDPPYKKHACFDCAILELVVPKSFSCARSIVLGDLT